MRDGRPQVTPVWCDFDGPHVPINAANGPVKDRNMRHDPRVTLAIRDPYPYRYLDSAWKGVDITRRLTSILTALPRSTWGGGHPSRPANLANPGVLYRIEIGWQREA